MNNGCEQFGQLHISRSQFYSNRQNCVAAIRMMVASLFVFSLLSALERRFLCDRVEVASSNEYSSIARYYSMNRVTMKDYGEST